MSEDKFIINKTQVSQMLKISTKTVVRYQQREDDPLPIFEVAANGKANKYDGHEILLWAIRQRENKLATTDDGEVIDYEYERARLTKAQADAQEFKNEIARREVAPVEMLEWSLSKVASQAKSVFESIPLKVKNRVPSLKSSEIEIIRREVIKVQNAFANLQLNFDEYEDSN